MDLASRAVIGDTNTGATALLQRSVFPLIDTAFGAQTRTRTIEVHHFSIRVHVA